MTRLSLATRRVTGGSRTPLVIAGVRMLLGGVVLARPTALTRSLGVDRTTAGRVGWLTRMVGVREVALGAGGALAVRRGGDTRTWGLAQAACDATDAAAVLAALRRGQVNRFTGALVVGSAAVAAAAGAAAAVAVGRGAAGPRQT